MYLMFADEADQDGARDFLVYAAVFFPSEQVEKIVSGVQKLRESFGFGDTDRLKFSTGTKPEHIEREQHTEIKNAVIALANETGCKVFCYLVSHDLARNQDLGTKLKWATIHSSESSTNSYWRTMTWGQHFLTTQRTTHKSHISRK